MKVSLSVRGLPPKKDGANSMWNKPVEIPRLRQLRHAAAQAMNGQLPLTSPLRLQLRLYANPSDGDLDSFITGVCDALMAAHTRTPIDFQYWNDLPEAVRPNQPIVFYDDSCITKIEAERLPPGLDGPRYDVEIESV